MHGISQGSDTRQRFKLLSFSYIFCRMQRSRGLLPPDHWGREFESHVVPLSRYCEGMNRKQLLQDVMITWYRMLSGQYYTRRSRDSAIGMAIGCGLDDGRSGVQVSVGFSFLRSVQTGYGVYPVSYTMDIGTLSPRIKWQGREADHSPPISAAVKKTWTYTSTSSFVSMA
jgi:hypothetical protein